MPASEKHLGGRPTALRAGLVLLVAALLVWAAPLIGRMLAGAPVAPFLAFPPRTLATAHAPFSWPVFAAMAVPCALVVLLFAWAVRVRAAPPRGPFPWWGALGVVVIAAGWTCAWWDGLVPAPLRRHTFAVLWLGYIFAINALTLRASGRCPLTHRPPWLLALFVLSAAFWWLFEFLNQFVNNWYYAGIAADGDIQYLLQATVPFATVLPAVASTVAWLDTHVALRPLPRLRGSRALAWSALGLGTAALAGIGVWPETLYSALWLGPLLVVAALQRLLLGESSLGPLGRGDWRPLLVPALAGLFCGLLWELWNFGSAAKWHYAIPYVQRFHLFEMPLLGYAGYLPFGVLCILVADVAAALVEGRAPRRATASAGGPVGPIAS